MSSELHAGSNDAAYMRSSSTERMKEHSGLSPIQDEALPCLFPRSSCVHILISVAVRVILETH